MRADPSLPATPDAPHTTYGLVHLPNGLWEPAWYCPDGHDLRVCGGRPSWVGSGMHSIECLGCAAAGVEDPVVVVAHDETLNVENPDRR